MALPSYNEKTVGSNDSQSELEKIPSVSASITRTICEESEMPLRSCKLSAKVIEDAVLGLSDGLTVPFALTAGLSAFGKTKLVVLGGLAELLAGMISMGLGGFVGAQSAREDYKATSRTCDALIQTSPQHIKAIIADHFDAFGILPERIETISNKLISSPSELKLFLMKYHYNAEEPPRSRAWISALTLGLSYFLGGLLPLVPYFFFKDVNDGLYSSIGVMGVVLLAFGYCKTCIVRGFAGKENIRAGFLGAAQMLLVGGIAAGAAIGLVRGLNEHVWNGQ